jgi:hypothetical protein
MRTDEREDQMTDHPNVSPIRDDDRGLIDGPVSFVPLHRAIASGTVATREPSLKKSRPFGRVSTIARVAEALASPRFILFYLGFYSGCMATVALALVWVRCSRRQSTRLAPKAHHVSRDGVENVNLSGRDF